VARSVDRRRILGGKLAGRSNGTPIELSLVYVPEKSGSPQAVRGASCAPAHRQTAAAAPAIVVHDAALTMRLPSARFDRSRISLVFGKSSSPRLS
jgi:hypothetical protein